MPRLLRCCLIGLATALCLVLTGCGADEPDATDEPSAPESSATEPTPAGQSDATASASAKPTKDTSGTTINITFKGDKVDPSGVERKVGAGKPFTLHIVADGPGELHVHSSPEQELRYPAGTTDETLTIEQPGIVEVESHTLDTLVVQLEVR